MGNNDLKNKSNIEIEKEVKQKNNSKIFSGKKNIDIFKIDEKNEYAEDDLYIKKLLEEDEDRLKNVMDKWEIKARVEKDEIGNLTEDLKKFDISGDYGKKIEIKDKIYDISDLSELVDDYEFLEKKIL